MEFDDIVNGSSKTFLGICKSTFGVINDSAAGIILLTPIVILLLFFLYDALQTKHTIRRNFPVLGLARYFLELIGPELRQYLFHDEKSDRPIPRYIRTWVYAHCKKELATVAFGTLRDIDEPGTLLMRHSAFPINKVSDDFKYDHRVTIGSRRKHPYSCSLFNISAMSYGALGKNAILALNHGAKQGNFYHNSGEGGVSKYHREGGADLVVQIGTGKFGVRDLEGNFSEGKFTELAAMEQVKMFEIKLSQGAKPGKGGVLPKEKITEEISRARGVPIGKDVISPPAHKEWKDEVGMLNWLKNLQDIGEKPVGIKFCLGNPEFIDRLVAAMKQTNIMPDFISIDGAEGATGAAPLAHTDYLGYPLKDALMMLDNKLREAGMRDEIKIIASAKVFTGADLAIMIALGADLCTSARGFMLAIGCIHALKCNTNHCPSGVATHNPWLERGLVVKNKIPRVAHYHHAVLYEFCSLLHACGHSEPSQLSRKDVMKVIDHHKIVSMDELVPQPPVQACKTA